MADEYSINAKITADTSKFNKGVKNAQTSLKGFSKGLSDTINKLGKNGLVGSLASVSLAGAGLTTVFNSVIKITKNISKAINEVTNAYKGQLMAERALDTAIQNNPYMTGESSRALKEFASEIQRVSNYGDEELLPLIANLTSLGRTEEEIMQIVRVATDMASTGTMSLDTAITQLNATLNGNLGRLGQQNAELKDLTEEELRQGKAVEILGEKFKGLSSATADTSKQLQNLKGDFKEALGQFTLPASDMWNKFWSGFYLEGINALNKFDDYLDYKVIGKKLSKNFEEYYKGLSGTREQKEFAVEDYLAIITDDELNMLELYLKSLNKLNEAQLVTINQIQYEKKHREYKKEVEQQELEIQEKQNKLKEEEEAKEVDIAKLKEEYLAKIEAQKKEWENIKAVTGEEVKNEEKLKFYQDQLVGIMTEAGGKITENNQYYKDQMKIIEGIQATMTEEPEASTEWQDKLLQLRIETLEKERDFELQNTELTESQKVDIVKEYGPKIFALKEEQLLKEREIALNEEGLTEEERLAVKKIYSIKMLALQEEEAKKIIEITRNKKKEEVNIEQKGFSDILKVAQNYAKTLASTFKNVVSTIGRVISGVGNIFSNLFSLDVDDALTNLLIFEDSVLTFFVETLPKLPKFMQSAVQSILTMFEQLITNIDFDEVAEIVGSVVSSIFDLITGLSSYINKNSQKIINGFTNIVKSVIKSISEWVKTGGWKELLNAILTIQKTLETMITENLEDIAQTVADMLPDLVQFIVDSIVSASRTLGKIAKVLLPLFAKIINAIIEAITSDEVVESSIEAIEGIIEGLIPAVVDILVNGLPKLINFFLFKLPSYVPKLIAGIIKALVKGFSSVNWGQVVQDIFTGFIDAFKDMFGIHSPSTLFESFGGYIVEGFINGLKGIADATVTMISPIVNLLKDTFTGLGSLVFESMQASLKGLLDIINVLGSLTTNLTNSVFAGLKVMIESTVGPMRVLGKVSIATMGAIAKAMADVHNTLRNIIKSATTLHFWTPWQTYDFGGVDIGVVPTPDLSGYIDLINSFATGTNDAPKGLALVGEAGPELVRFNGGEQVLNARNTQKALDNAGGSSNTFNVNFTNVKDTSAYALVSQLKQYNRQLAINGVL